MVINGVFFDYLDTRDLTWTGPEVAGDLYNSVTTAVHENWGCRDIFGT